MPDDHTTIVVQRYLDQLAGVRGESSAEPIIGALLGRAVHRLNHLCENFLNRNYPRLTRAPLNLHGDELLSAVAERLLKAMRKVHPTTVRQFFALANQHMRWELNDVARRLDKQERHVEINDSGIPAPPPSSGSPVSPNCLRMLEAIDSLPAEEREVFDLVRIQGMAQVETAEILGIAVRTVQRRLNRAMLLLSEKLTDLSPMHRLPEQFGDSQQQLV